MPIPFVAIAPLIASAMSAAGGQIARGRAVRDRKEERAQYIQDREYNSPRNQINRLKEAGLPMAAYLGGGASQQSQTGQGSPQETDTGFQGAGEAISAYHSTRLERIAAQAAEENLAILKNQRKISDAETAHHLGQEADITTKGFENGKMEETFVPRFVNDKQRAQQMQEANILSKEFQNNMLKRMDNIDNVMYLSGKKLDSAIAQINKQVTDWLNAEKEGVLKTINIGIGQNELDYSNSEIKYKKLMLEVRHQIFEAIKNGKMPNFKNILMASLVALENRL